MKKIKLADIHMWTVVRPVPSVLHIVILNLTIADNFITNSYDNSYISINNPISHPIKHRNPGRDHANYVIEPVYWRCID